MANIISKELSKRACNKLLDRHAYDQALAKAQQGIKDYPKDVHFHIYSTWALIELQQWTQALTQVDASLATFTDNPVLQNLKGEILFKQGQLDDALAILAPVYQQTPDNLHTSYLMGQIYAAKGDLNASSKYFESILAYDPKLLQVRLLSMAERYIFETSKRNPSP